MNEGDRVSGEANRYMNIGVKRNLTLETDLTPDVKTLALRTTRVVFVECLTYAEGVKLHPENHVANMVMKAMEIMGVILLI
jgi:hypothetical protein